MSNTISSRAARTILTVAFAAAICNPYTATAGPILGSAASFAVLGSSTVTNTGSTTINGNIGLYPGTSITGLGSVTLTGTVDQTNAMAQQAQIDATNGFNSLAVMPLTETLTGTDLGGLTLNPGVYFFASSAQLTGTLTLNALNDPNALFVFQIGSTLTTASSSVVDIMNANVNTGIFWEVGSSATLGTGTLFGGNIIAEDSITMTTGASILCGSALALTGAVTLDTNTISTTCSSEVGTGSGPGGGANSAPEPGTIWLACAGLLAIALRARRSKRETA